MLWFEMSEYFSSSMIDYRSATSIIGYGTLDLCLLFSGHTYLKRNGFRHWNGDHRCSKLWWIALWRNIPRAIRPRRNMTVVLYRTYVTKWRRVDNDSFLWIAALLWSINCHWRPDELIFAHVRLAFGVQDLRVICWVFQQTVDLSNMLHVDRDSRLSIIQFWFMQVEDVFQIGWVLSHS